MNVSIARATFLHAITPVHAGTGQVASVVDLPTARERATGWPFIPGSSLRGVLRDEARQLRSADWVRNVFGPEPDEKVDFSGRIHISDQLILFFPARSFFGTFAFITCPLALTRMIRDFSAIGVKPPFRGPVPVPGESQAHVLPDTALTRANKAYLEDLDLNATPDAQAKSIADGLAQVLFPQDSDIFLKRFALVSDAVFDFLCETATDISARIRLNDDTKTVEHGALWYEESVPAEAVFYGFAINAKYGHTEDSNVLQFFDQIDGRTIQIGGSAGVGRGLVRLIVGGKP
ncbi:MAG: type III-B CRISPR module RAMP protein Cmr4 [Bacillota bacterium]